ncbi:MAG: nucleotidyltransferase substrate binding protein [Lachnospiraceae bacterium]|nr:nucleotidyltransferase substrate binding protein [Lachnospiraceae bacterium]MBQ8947857.1 nucleotidyltransferase substrate binding protein [Lachnospiraceae bacterium]
MDSKSINRYSSFCDSLRSLEKAKYRDGSDEFVVSGTVQKFNLTFDISWKVMKDIIVKYHKINDFATGSPRETLRTAASVGLIDDDRWMDMLELRNTLTHDYDGAIAGKSFGLIINEYYLIFERLRDAAGRYMDQD